MSEARVVVEGDQTESPLDLALLQLTKEIIEAVAQALQLAGHASRNIQDEDEVQGSHVLGHEDRLGTLLPHPSFGEQGQQQAAEQAADPEYQLFR